MKGTPGPSLRERANPLRRARARSAAAAPYFTLDPAVGADESVCDWPARDGDTTTRCALRALGPVVVGGTRRHLCRRHRRIVAAAVGHLFDLEVMTGRT